MKNNNNNSVSLYFLVFCIVCLSSFNANAVSISHLPTDIDLIINTLNNKAFVTEERIGDLGENETFELGFDTDTSITVYNLALTDFIKNKVKEERASSQASGNSSGLDILWINATLLDYDWTLSGTSTMSWKGSVPTNSRLAYQVKVGNATLTGGESFPVPEPSSFILLGIGCAGLFILKKKNAFK